MNKIIQNGMCIYYTDNGKLYIDNKIVDMPSGFNRSNVTIINNKVFINGYELVNGKWKRTIRALFHKWF